MNNKNNIGLYVHIPFCERICSYCDFVKRVEKNTDRIDYYIDELLKEIDLYKDKFDQIETIFIGGGTPNVLSDYNLERLLKKLSLLKNVKEFSIELNPELYTNTQGQLFKKYGLNRISLGVESFDSKTLEFLNRNHNKKHVKNCVNDLRKLGITNISFDIIYGIPYQTFKQVKKDIYNCIKLKPKHISCYSLIIEDKTYLGYLYQRRKIELLDDNLIYKMHKFILRTLKLFGYSQYEVGNYSKKGYQSLHNIKYWTQQPYIGVGLGSSGFDGKNRYRNQRIFSKYTALKHQYEKVELTDLELVKEAFIMGLRMNKGVNYKQIEKQYNIDVFKTFPNLLFYIEKKFLKIKKDYLYITKKARFISNTILEEFV